jgi:hypothetical protein
VAEEQEIMDFEELVKLIQGMRGHIVEASILLPWEAGVARFSGRLRDVASTDRREGQCWVLTWDDSGDWQPVPSAVVLWERRFIRGELSFTGSVDDGRGEDRLEVDETQGHNIFLKVYSEGWNVDLISYVGA